MIRYFHDKFGRDADDLYISPGRQNTREGFWIVIPHPLKGVGAIRNFRTRRDVAKEVRDKIMEETNMPTAEQIFERAMEQHGGASGGWRARFGAAIKGSQDDGSV